MTDPNVSSLEIDKLAPTSVSLLERAKAADGKAWTRIVDLYAPLVLCWFRESGLQDADTHDLSQSVFQSVYLNLKSFRRDRPGDSFRGWIRRITRNKYLDFCRSKGRSLEIVGSGVVEAAADSGMTEWPSNEDAISERNTLLHRAIGQLRGEVEDRTWTAFWNVTVEGVSPSDVAKSLNMSVNSVYLAKSRILCRLYELYGELIEDLDSP